MAQIWMKPPAISKADSDCPPGLQYLTTLDHLLVVQKREYLEETLGYETRNMYSVKNHLGEQVYWVEEETSCWQRNCCGQYRPIDMIFITSDGSRAIHIYRPRLGCCWCCYFQTMEVFSPPGNLIGSISYVRSWHPKFDLKNAAGDIFLHIEGPVCTTACFSNVNFKVLALDRKTIVGKLSKNWGGLGREMFGDADVFGVSFPKDLNVREKAVMLAASFLIDIIYYEARGRSRVHGGFAAGYAVGNIN